MDQRLALRLALQTPGISSAPAHPLPQHPRVLVASIRPGLPLDVILRKCRGKRAVSYRNDSLITAALTILSSHLSIWYRAQTASCRSSLSSSPSLKPACMGFSPHRELRQSNRAHSKIRRRHSTLKHRPNGATWAH